MWAVWDGNLLNGPLDIVIDTTLLSFIAWAYLPQIRLIRDTPSLSGLSPFYVLAQFLLSNAQLSYALIKTYLLWPNRQRPVIKEVRCGNLVGLRAFGAVLGLLQIILQWLLAMATLMFFVANSRDASLISGFIAVVGLFHTAIAMLPPYVIMRYGRENIDMGQALIGQVMIWASTNITAPLALIIGFIAQMRELIAQAGRPGALSISSLGLQTLLFTLLSFRWFQRLGRPMDHHPMARFHMPVWYVQVQYEWSFFTANYAIQALVCALVWYGYHLYDHSS